MRSADPRDLIIQSTEFEGVRRVTILVTGDVRQVRSSRLSSLGSRLSSLVSRLSSLGSRLSALGSRLSSLGSRLSALGSRLSALDSFQISIGALPGNDDAGNEEES
jgi:hypothetical protein